MTVARAGSSHIGVIAAVDVGGTAAKTATVTADGTVSAVRSYPLAELRGTPDLVPEVVRICCAAVGTARAAQTKPVAAVGLIVPGIVAEKERRGVSSMLLGWRDVPFGELVEEACGLPTVLGHDVRSAARAEFTAAARAGDQVDDALFVTLGTGVGSAALVGGLLRTGGHGLGGEIAHVVVDRKGPSCPCGKRGCVETTSSGPAIARAYREVTGVEAAAQEVADLVRAGDPAATAVWENAAAMLARAVGTYCEMLDPIRVILGGGVAAAGDLLLAPVRRFLVDEVALPVGPQVSIARLGPLAGVHGAAALALEAVTPAAVEVL